MSTTRNKIILSLEEAKELSTRVVMRAAVAERRRQKTIEKKKAISAKKQAQSRSRNQNRREVFQKLLAHTIRNKESVEFINPDPDTILCLEELGFKNRVVYVRKQDRVALLEKYEKLNNQIKPWLLRLDKLTHHLPDNDLKKSKIFKDWAKDYPKTRDRYGQTFENFEGLVDLLFGFENQTTFDDEFVKFGDPPPEVLVKGLQVLYKRLSGREFGREDYLNWQTEIYKLEHRINCIQQRIDRLAANPNFIYESSIRLALEIPLKSTTARSDDDVIKLYAHCLNWAGSLEGRLFYSAISVAIRSAITRRENKLSVEISDTRRESAKSASSSDYRLPTRKRKLKGPPSEITRLMLAPLGFSTVLIRKVNGQVLELSGW